MNEDEEEELCKEITRLKGQLEAAHRKIRDLEHHGIHRLVVRELGRDRNVDIREMDGKYIISAGEDHQVESGTLHEVVAAAWDAWG